MFLAAFLAAALPMQDPGSLPLRVLSFNIRYGTARDGENAWPNRRDLVARTIVDQDAQVIGLQEALAAQLDDLAAALPPHYTFLGQGRRGGREDEHASLLIDTRRLEVREHGDFWLSPTPDKVASKGWDAALPRICTWARLLDRRTGGELVVLNTHFDHRGDEARNESAHLIAAQVRRWQHLPVLVTGDLNAGEDSEPLRVLRAAGLRDTLRVADPEATEVGTFNGFTGARGGAKIDYVLASAHWQVEAAAIVRTERDGHYPSDHYPIGASVTIAPQVALMPVLDGDFWQLTENPEIEDVGRPGQQTVDHAIFRASDDSWQVQGCVRYTKVGRLLFRWQGPSLRGAVLAPVGVAMRADPSAGESLDEEDGTEWIQAPFVFRQGDGYRMLYGGHRSESGASQICLASSDDGLTFRRHRGAEGRSRVFVGPGEARDPVVLRIGDRFYCYYCGHDDGAPSPCKVYCRTSTDLLSWSEPIAVNWGGSGGDGRWSAECPFVVERHGYYYLFRTSDYVQRLTHVYRSTDPLDFGKGDDSRKIGVIRVAAPELVADAQGEMISSVHGMSRGIQLAALRWIPEAQAPTSLAFDRRFERLWDFENGNVEGWRAKGKAFAKQPQSRSIEAVADHALIQGDYFVASDDERTGELRSPVLELPNGHLTLRVAGARNAEKLYVALVLVGGRELHRATGNYDRVLERIVWDVHEYAGKKAYLQLVDDLRLKHWGTLAIDDVRIERKGQ